MGMLFRFPILFSILRIFLYTLILIGIWYLMILDSTSTRSDEKFGEHSYTEDAQLVLLIFNGFLLLSLVWKDVKVRGFAIGLLGFMAILSIRELNNFFHTLFIGAWQLVVTILATLTAILIWKNRATVYKPLRKFIKTPAFGLSLAGLLVVMVFSRLYGLHGLWNNLMGEPLTDAHRWVKNASEEGIELLGYALLTFGIIEYTVVRWQKQIKASTVTRTQATVPDSFSN